MNNIEALKNVLEKITGKTLEGEYVTMVDMLTAFTGLFKCKVTFDIVDSSTAYPLEDAVLIVKDTNGNTLTPGADGKYNLEEGLYTYDCTCEGYTDKEGVSVSITSSDIENETKSVTVAMVAVEEAED